jgi:hypothetical protein
MEMMREDGWLAWVTKEGFFFTASERVLVAHAESFSLLCFWIHYWLHN